MLLTGQPLHAFDLDRLAGGRIVVRRAGDGESITTLDGQERTLDSSMLAICDAERPGGHRGHLRRRVRRGGAGHHPGAAGGGHLRRPHDPQHLARAGPAQRVQRALREGPAPAAAAARHGHREPPAGGAVRRPPGAGHPRRARAAARARDPVGAQRAHRPHPGRGGGRPTTSAAILARLGCDVRVLQDGVTATSRSSGPRTSPARSTSSRRSAASGASTTSRRSCRASPATGASRRRRRASAAWRGSPPTSASPRPSPTARCPSPTSTRCASPTTTRAARWCGWPTP